LFSLFNPLLFSNVTSVSSLLTYSLIMELYSIELIKVTAQYPMANKKVTTANAKPANSKYDMLSNF